MSGLTVFFAILRFGCWEAALFAAAAVLAWRLGFTGRRRLEEKLFAVLAIQVALESSFAGLCSFTGINAPWVYWTAAAVCLLGATASRQGREVLAGSLRALRTAELLRYPRTAALFAALLSPLVFLSFRPVEEADSINYLHYLIDWMANRSTPYTFATNYVAFWELSFLPSWILTRVDLFFPLLALKAIVLLALAVWLTGRELGVRRHVLLWAALGAVLLRHMWWEFSGIPTLKNDVLHGVGFVLLVLVVLRAARRRLTGADVALFAFGGAFVTVKYTGIFLVALAAIVVLYLARKHLRPVPVLLAAGFILLTSGHYYLHNLLLYGSPFYPFQINLAFLHLPGTADLSATSILYNLRNPNLWRAFFLPSGGLSVAGLLFPLVLAATLAVSVAAAVPAVRRRAGGAGFLWTALFVLAGWFLYFRSVYSAGTVPGDIGFALSLNTIRYVFGVLAVSELLLLSLISRFPKLALALIVLNTASRLSLLYAKLPLSGFPLVPVLAAAAAAGLVALLLLRFVPLAVPVAAALMLLAAGPLIDLRNHAGWLAGWDDIRPALAAVRGPSLALLGYSEFGFWAGHVLAAGNPVHPEVRALTPEDLDALPPRSRPRYLAALPTPGSSQAADWKTLHAAAFVRWGYTVAADAKLGAILERTLPPVAATSTDTLDAWYAPSGSKPVAGMPLPGGHVLQDGDLVADPAGAVVRLEPAGRRPVQPVPGLGLRLANCGSRQTGAFYRWVDGRWRSAASSTDAAVLPSPSWIVSISDGTYRQVVLAEDRLRFVRIRAQNDARWLIYSAAYPEDLPDGEPVSIRAVVRCPNGCSISTAGHDPELEKAIKSDAWTTLNLSYAYQKNGKPQHYAVGLSACHRGDGFDLRGFELRVGLFPYD